MKRTRLRRKSKSPRSQYVEYLTYLWGTIVLIKDKTCVVCGGKATDPHHIFSKQSCPSVRYDTRNGAGLCKGHHRFGVHQNPEKYRQKIIDHVGGKEYELLKYRAMTSAKGKMDLAGWELILLDELREYGHIIIADLTYKEKIILLKEMRRGNAQSKSGWR